ncbi:PTS glucitol/sorbitol transporter subunit IIA [Propionispora vibrioides]|uniref:PTS system, glucitol/sorbitol-specific IIA component n=1 Tax=Propionispora vibrioides TaxID=112903 RepID=A0A1H8WV90_9FIRM|nr:PTS glucitol/sorbitol transporter subunit IIA [Propionispora vibrioides]SEP31575.1 PTS system, glucitol/sorbitol-specific IIA component [Propionispora vibrioides]
MDIYRTVIQAIGSYALDFLETDVLITFYPQAPDGLKDYCLILTQAGLVADIQVGDYLVLGEKRYFITAVGPVASENLRHLGHISLRFDGAITTPWAGSIHLAGGKPRAARVGETLAIEREA